MNMKKIMQKLSSVFLFFAILFAVVTAGLILYNLFINFKITDEFVKKEDAYPYAEEVENGIIDFDEIKYIFPVAAALSESENSFKKDIISPVTISYYKDMNDTAPAYVIEKGATIHFDVGYKLQDTITYHGSDSIPTNEPGWRLAKPFITEGKEKNDTLFYVKLDDLMQVTYEWIEENSQLARKILPGVVMEQGRLPTKYNMSKFMLLLIDYLLYDNGVFSSPDLLNPVFSAVSLITLCISAGLFVLFFLTKYKLKRDNRISDMKAV